MIDRRTLFPLGLAGAAFASTRTLARSVDRERIALWNPGAIEAPPAGLQQTFTERSKDPAVRDRSLQGVTSPFIEVWRPARTSSRASILIMPGGGYHHLAWDKEGPDIARWFNGQGITAFVLAYRLSVEGWQRGVEAPLADAMRAMRLIRARSEAWGLNPDRIAAMGFSAGGHLCANLAARFADPVYPASDKVDALSARPVLAAPIYPAIKLEAFPAAQFGHGNTTAMLVANSPDRNVPANAPPHYILQAEDDPLVDPEHALALRAALHARKIPVETRLVSRGGHGFGLRPPPGTTLENWPLGVMAFGRMTGWLSK